MQLSLRAVNSTTVSKSDLMTTWRRNTKYIQLGRYAVHVSDSWLGFLSCTQSLLHHSSRRKAEILYLEDKTCPLVLGFVWDFTIKVMDIGTPLLLRTWDVMNIEFLEPNLNLFSLPYLHETYTKGLLSIGPKGFNDNHRPRTDSFC